MCVRVLTHSASVWAQHESGQTHEVELTEHRHSDKEETDRNARVNEISTKISKERRRNVLEKRNA